MAQEARWGRDDVASSPYASDRFVGRDDPVAVPKIFCALGESRNFDRGHSLISLHPPPAPLDSLPTSRRAVDAEGAPLGRSTSVECVAVDRAGDNAKARNGFELFYSQG